MYSMVRSLQPSLNNDKHCYVCDNINSRKSDMHFDTCDRFCHLSCAKTIRKTSAALPMWDCPDCAVGFPSSIQSTITSTPVTSSGGCVDLYPLDVATSSDSSKIPVRIPKGATIYVTDAMVSSIDTALNRCP